MDTRYKILIVEDEDAIRMALEDDFSYEGYDVATASGGPEGLARAMDPTLDLILLDVMLPEMSGFEICRTLRSRQIKTPIIMLTAKSQEIDKVMGLDYGADDYITKPFSSRELHARIKANLRRSRFISLEAQVKAVYSFGDVEVDFHAHEVRKGGKPLSLTHMEFLILSYFIEYAGKVVTRDDLLDDVWGENVMVTVRTVDTHIVNLRKKIEDNSAEPKWILSIRGVGYKFNVNN